VTVIILERVPVSLRGELTRWMLEPATGVFVGRVSALVRQKLWEYACSKLKGGGGMMLYASDSEQGYSIETYGKSNRSIVDFEGLLLVRV